MNGTPPPGEVPARPDHGCLPSVIQQEFQQEFRSVELEGRQRPATGMTAKHKAASADTKDFHAPLPKA